MLNPVDVAIPFITILFLLLVGMGVRRWKLVTPEGARQVAGLVLNVTLPPLIFDTLASEVTPRELARAPLLAVMGAVASLAGYAVAAAISHLPVFHPRQRATFQATVALTNTAFVGYPLCEALLGSRGLLYAVLYDVGLTTVMSTLSIWLLSKGGRGGGWRAMLRSPMMWSLALGVIWGALGMPTPRWLFHPLRTLGQATTPLALLTVGMLIGVREGGRQRWPQIALLLLARLIVLPALIWTMIMPLGMDRPLMAVIVLQTAMPTAVSTTAMVEQYGGDASLAATGVALTTIASLATLPMWSMLLLADNG